jgi:hypothetical protein
MTNGNGCYFCKYKCRTFIIVFTFYIAYIILYWTITISNDVGSLLQIVQTRAIEDATLDIPEGSVGHGRGRGQAPHVNPPPPPLHAPVSIEDLLATQNKLMRVLVQNEAHLGMDRSQHHKQQDMNTSYSDFLATHPPVFSRAKDPLDQDDWLCTTESKFALLHCIEYQKTWYAAQQLRGPTGTWWASYIAALPADHYVAWDEFRIAFCGHHLSVGTMRRKLVEFLELRQGNHSVYEFT